MSRGAAVGYCLIPAFVYLTIGVGQRGLQWPDAETLRWFVGNYLFFAAPQLLWTLALVIDRSSRGTPPASPMSHAGYLGPTASLLTLHAQFEVSGDNGNAMGWLFLWPSALVAMALSVALVVWSEKRHDRPAGISTMGAAGMSLIVGVAVVCVFEWALRGFIAILG